jgi:chemotaxis protein CheD
VRSIVVGGCAVSDDPRVIITTTLGSCVATCLFDPVAGIGGMNHFLLPDPRADGMAAARYGSAAMEHLINRLFAHVGRRDRLRAKVFGGANVSGLANDIGRRNVEFVMNYLGTEGIPTVSWDVGGTRPRAIRFYPASGRSLRRLIGTEQYGVIAQTEASFMESINSAPIEGDVELF